MKDLNLTKLLEHQIKYEKKKPTPVQLGVLSWGWEKRQRERTGDKRIY